MDPLRRIRRGFAYIRARYGGRPEPRIYVYLDGREFDGVVREAVAAAIEENDRRRLTATKREGRRRG